MKLVWSPETASKAYIETVKLCELFEESSVAELISAMAGGWNAKLIVEAWSQGGVITTSVGLAIASRHTRGRHVCVVPNERSRSEYVEKMTDLASMTPEVIVGEAEEVMSGLVGVDFLVVDCKSKDLGRILRFAKFGQRGAVLVCKNASASRTTGGGFRWHGVVDGGSRVVRTVFLPVGEGLEIAHIGADAVGASVSSAVKGTGRWIRHIDRQSGEEYVWRR